MILSLSKHYFALNCRVSLPTLQLKKSEYYFIHFHLFVKMVMSANLVLAAILMSIFAAKIHGDN